MTGWCRLEANHIRSTISFQLLGGLIFQPISGCVSFSIACLLCGVYGGVGEKQLNTKKLGAEKRDDDNKTIAKIK